MRAKLTNLKTNSGKSIFPVGIGTWEIGSKINPSNIESKYRGVEPVRGNEDKEIEAIRYSILQGQNHIDCAELYGGFYTDEIVGRAIKDVKRDDIFIADKLWKTSVEPGQVKNTVDKMLKKLGTDYIDLLYIHAPWPDVDWESAVAQIDDLIDSGIVRYFGVSNFSLSQLKNTNKSSKHGVSFVQQNFSIGYQDEADAEYRKWCELNDVQLVAYCPFDRQGKGIKPQLQLPEVTKMAKKYNCTTHQFALAWLIEVGAIPIPKSTSKNHIDENVMSVKISLTTEDMKKFINV